MDTRYSKLFKLGCVPYNILYKTVFKMLCVRYFWKTSYKLRDRFFKILSNKYHISRHRIQRLSYVVVCGRVCFKVNYLSHRRHKRYSTVWLS